MDGLIVGPDHKEDPFGDHPLDTTAPNFKKHVANLHYQSELTNEFGTIQIRPGTTEDHVLWQYAKLFPRECASFLEEIKNCNQVLNSPTGMSKERRIMALTKIPEIVYTAMKFIDEDYWADKEAFYRFIRKYPRFMIGDHKKK